MHPIERLRYVARSGWGSPALLGAEAAYALAGLAEHEPAALLPACRRLLERNPGCGPLWWVAARMLVAPDAMAEALSCAEALEDDPSEEILDAEVPVEARVVRRGGIGEVAAADVVVVGCDALGHSGMLLDPDDCGLVRAARDVGVPIWVMAGAGRVLPSRLWDAVLERIEAPGPLEHHVHSFFDAGDSLPRGLLVDLRGVERVVGPWGACDPRGALGRADCPEPPELLVHW